MEISAYQAIDIVFGVHQKDTKTPIKGLVICCPTNGIILCDSLKGIFSKIKEAKTKSNYPRSVSVRKGWIHFEQNRKYWTIR